MAFCPEHPKWDQNLKFTSLRETKSIPFPSICGVPLGELSRITRNLEDLNCRLLQLHGTRWVVENNYNYETTKILDPSESDILIKKTFLISESELTVSNITFYHMCLISLFSWNNCKGTSRKYPQVISDKLFTDSPLNGLMFACDLNLAWDREGAWLSDWCIGLAFKQYLVQVPLRPLAGFVSWSSQGQIPCHVWA